MDFAPAAKEGKTWDECPSIATHNELVVRGFFGDYRWLSNFYPCAVPFEGLVYPSSEHAYQAAKTEPDNRLQFIDITAAQAKKKGKTIATDIDAWNAKKDGIMHNIVLFKFIYNNDLSKKLLETNQKYLEETNWWGDTYWGVHNGKGQNKLGHILMNIRTELKLS